MSKLIYDIEVYPNYMMVGFMTTRGLVRSFETWDKLSKQQIKDIKRLIKNYTLVGFNSKSYDDPILSLMLKGQDVKAIYKASKAIVEDENVNWWNVWDKFDVTNKVNSIDLIDVAPGQASLKLYGARLNSIKLQDLPYDPHTPLLAPETKEVCSYNVNDLQTTLDLYNRLTPMLELREKISSKYDIDVMSKSDAQIAEAIFRHELTKKGVKVQKGDKQKTVKYKAPDIVGFYREDLNLLVDKIEDTTIELNAAGQPILPKWLKDTTIDIGDSTYNIGLGGLHSQEKQLVVIPKEDEVLCNVDVASYYPSLIIDLGLYPKHLSKDFLKIYSNVKATRLEAKAKKGDKTLSEKERAEAKVTDAVLKILLNGSYGKFGSKYSFLYSPDLLLTVTFTGQLYLLMLIEELERNGLKVVSSNTDGVEVLRKKGTDTLLQDIVEQWEKDTGMVMEFGEYEALYARDVNNYVAVYPGGKGEEGKPTFYTKAKGDYVDPKDAVPILMKNIEYPIVFEAIREYLAKGTPMEDTIYECEDIARFCSSRTVKGGAIYYDGKLEDSEEYINYINDFKKQNKALEKRNDDYHKEQVLNSPDSTYLGKVVRWYYSINGNTIFYKSGNKVPKAVKCKPMMELTDDIPKDLDYDKYLELCNKHLEDLGVTSS